MKKILTLLAAAVLGITACNKTPSDPEEDLPLIVTPSELTFEAAPKAAQIINVSGPTDWTAATTAEWLSLTPSADAKTIVVSAAANTGEKSRTATISVKTTSKASKVTVTQAGNGPVIPPLPETIKILAIGNSFSADAVEQELYGLFESIGQKVVIGDMYIGGCPLEKHAANCKSDAAAYSYRKCVNGKWTTTSSVKLSTALADEDWTFVSVQEGAGYHGFYDDTYKGTTHKMEPNLTTVINYVLEKCKNKDVRIVYHAPWVAKADYTGTKFSYYGFDQKVMYDMIIKSTKQVLEAHPEISVFMNVMDAIQNLRSSYIGDNVTRDGWHLNYTVGRYTAGCLWFEKIMGRSVVGNTYHPTTISDYTANVCQTAAHEACEHPYQTTDLSYFKKPADEGGDDDAKKEVLAKWYFSPARAKSDGCIKTWTGQESIGVWTYSNEPGERGYYPANEEGSGKLSWIQVDKTKWPINTGSNIASGLQVFDVSNGGQPVMCGPMAGDCWQFETIGKGEFAEGTQLHMVFRYNPGANGAKYWMVEYKDGETFKPVPAFPSKTITLPKGGETITYNQEFANEQKTVEFTVTLENPTNEFVVRMVCCSMYEISGNWYDHPDMKSQSRVAGDPNNANKPLPQMDKML